MSSKATLAPHSPSRRQRGVSTLVVAIVLLIAATFITFLATKVGVQEQRMSGNDFRHKETFSVAEAGLDRAKAYLAANRQSFATWVWTACTAGQTTLPCGDGTINRFGAAWSWVNVNTLSGGAAVAGLNWAGGAGPFILTRSTPAAIAPGTSFQPVTLLAQAASEDGTGSAVVRQSMSRYLIAQPGPVPPIMAPSVGLGGNFTVVGNPNHDIDPVDVTLANCDNLSGSGQLLSIWSRSAVTLSGSQQTCNPGAYRDNSGNRCIGQTIPDPMTGSTPDWSQCICRVDIEAETAAYSSASATLDDVVQSDTTFPGDMFLYVFGRSKAAVKASAASAGRVLPNCSTLNASSTGLYWITGACDVAAGAVIGSRAAPVILVYETSAEFQGGADVWGMVVGADMERTLIGTPTGTAPYYYDTDFTSASPATAMLHGTFTLHGALIVEGPIAPTAGSGNYNILYDPCVFAAMGAGSAFDQYGPIAGSWNDAL
ncbi:MAG: pilus assembly PilX family protein [Immundisolibacter sp.]|uniref:pilus assembly PilX family protein n=1 Tax=Immundisolibacter sp. TaxID=1934948 RepID=UPI003EE24F58